jgi:hypothetical protein
MPAEIHSMRARVIVFGLAVAGIVWSGEKKPPIRSTENDLVEMTATALADRESVKQALGSDLDGHYILVDVRVTPKDGKKITISRDDFLLRTDKDGERTTPFGPSQIAGRGALVVSTGSESRSGPMMEQGGPLYGPGLGSPGGGFGSGGAGAESAQATVNSGLRDKPNPLLDVLKAKILPEKTAETPVSGLLYFPMEKQKLKDLELIYTTPEGKLSVRFK